LWKAQLDESATDDIDPKFIDSKAKFLNGGDHANSKVEVETSSGEDSFTGYNIKGVSGSTVTLKLHCSIITLYKFCVLFLLVDNYFLIILIDVEIHWKEGD
jgi:hypothetical protein